MPTASKPATSTSSKKSSSPSIPMFQKANVREFGGGRWEGGIATVVRGVCGPWKYPPKAGDPNPSNKHTLFSLQTLRDESGEEHIIPFQAGFFGATDPKDRGFYNNAYPSRDGVNPAGPEDMDMEELLEIYSKLAAGELVLSEEEAEDYYGISVVFRTDPENHTNIPKLPKKDWTQVTQSVEALPEFQGEGMFPFENSSDFNMLEGYKFEWAYMPQKYVSKKMKAQGKTSFEVLTPIRSFGKDEEWEAEQAEEEGTPVLPLSNKGPQSSKKKAAPAPPVEEEEEETEDEGVEESGEDELGDRVDAALLVTLQKIGHPAVKREFNATVAKMFKGPEQLEVLNNYLNNNKWMTSEDRSFTYADGKWSA